MTARSTTSDEYARCRSCLAVLRGVLDQRLRDNCQECVDELRHDPGRRIIPLQEIIKVNEPANE